MTNDDDCKRIVETTANHFGRIDILVNNAGAGAFGSIYDPKLMTTFDYMMKLDVRSVVLITQLAVPHLEKTKGVIVNISSTLSIKPVKFLYNFSISHTLLSDDLLKTNQFVKFLDFLLYIDY